MKHLKKYKSFEAKLMSEFLDAIFNAIDKKTVQPIVATIAGQFRFYLEDNYTKKLNEYLYRISDGEDMVTVVLDMSKEMKRDEELFELVHAIFPKYEVECLNNDDNYDITVGSFYTITDEFVENGIEYVELELNDSYEPYFTFPKSWFEKM